MLFDNTYAKVDLAILSDNFDAICARAGKPVMAIVKANAYGHGAVAVSRLLEDRAAFFGVSSVPEALQLRRAGIQKPILILGSTPPESFPEVIAQNIRPAIFRYEDALALSQEAQRQGQVAFFHFAVDTGMSRIGFQVTEADADICAAITKLPGLHAEGLFSHFATADCADLTRAKAQAGRFAQFDAMLRDRAVRIPLRHLDNSAGIMNFGCHYEMVRSGIITYGMYPSEQMDPSLLRVKPALSWHSRIVHLQKLPAGREISYGGTFVTRRSTLVATLPVGYADGYHRSLSNRFYVLVRGHKAPILGRVCMDQMMVDVTDIPDVRLGDWAVLIGRDGEESISIEAIAAAAGSFNYEFSCGIGWRVPRIHCRGSERIAVDRYLLNNE